MVNCFIHTINNFYRNNFIKVFCFPIFFRSLFKVFIQRGKLAESVHAAKCLIKNSNFKTILSSGHCKDLIFPRSAIKIFQAIPFIKSKAYKKQKKDARNQAKQMSQDDEFNPALDEKHDTHVDPKDRDELDNGPDAKGGAETAKKMKKAKEPAPNISEASGDKEAYKKFFDAALKKFKVTSPAELEGDQKKKFFDYVDKNWEGDNEKAEAAMSQVREFKIQSMKAALAQVWGMEEGKNPFKSEDHDDEKENEKRTKTETGKKPAVIDLKPKIEN